MARVKRSTCRLRTGYGLLVLMIWLSETAVAQKEHVTFLVMGKTTNYRQGADGTVKPLNYHFFAEVFVTQGGQVTDALLEFPDGSRQPFENLGYVLELHGGRYQSEKELDANYPNGDYRVSFDTPSGNVDGRVLSIRGTGTGVSRIPRAGVIFLEQNGRPVSPKSIDPDEDLLVRWSDFETGEADANGILDDLIFVVMADCRGEKRVHSGRPLEGTAYLTYADSELVIPAAKLAPGETHQMSLEHARVDTSRQDEIVGLVTYAATTFLDFQTTGRLRGEPCPAPSEMLKFDQGQTDRR